MLGWRLTSKPSWGQASVCRDPAASVCRDLAAAVYRGRQAVVYRGRWVAVCRDLAVAAYRGLRAVAYQGLAAFLDPVIVRPLCLPILVLPHRQPTPRLLRRGRSAAEPKRFVHRSDLGAPVYSRPFRRFRASHSFLSAFFGESIGTLVKLASITLMPKTSSGYSMPALCLLTHPRTEAADGQLLMNLSPNTSHGRRRRSRPPRPM